MRFLWVSAIYLVGIPAVIAGIELVRHCAHEGCFTVAPECLDGAVTWLPYSFPRAVNITQRRKKAEANR